MPFSKLWRLREKWRREMFLRGSPSYRLGVWAAGITGGLLWIWTVEKDMPIEERRIFLPLKRQIPMREDEILRWNAKLTGKEAQDLLPVPKTVLPVRSEAPEGMRGESEKGSAAEFKKQANCPLTVDELREKVKAEIEHEEAKKAAVLAKKKESLFGQLSIRMYR